MKNMLRFGIVASFFLCFFLVSIEVSIAHPYAKPLTVDTLYADSVILGRGNILDVQNVLGKPDSVYATLDSTQSVIFPLDLGFKYPTGGLYKIAQGSKVIIFGRKANVDSSAAFVQFFELDEFGGLTFSSQQYLLDGGNDTITPDRQYTYLEFTLTGGGTTNGSKAYLLDAVELIEDLSGAGVYSTQASATTLVQNYPNPFSANTQTQLTIHIEHAGNAELKIYDALGREVMQKPLGLLASGDHAVLFRAKEAGMFFTRLYLNGKPTGKLLKMTAIQ